MKKKKHKYKLGDILEFKFFDGGIKIGAVTKLTYAQTPQRVIDWKTPTYTITVKNSNPKRGAREYNYPCIGYDRIFCKLVKNHPHREYQS